MTDKKPLSDAELKEKLRNVKEIKFADQTQVEQQREIVARLLRIIGGLIVGDEKDELDDWVRHVFVSDESSVGDFLCETGELDELEKKLGFEVTANERIFEVALRMKPTQ